MQRMAKSQRNRVMLGLTRAMHREPGNARRKVEQMRREQRARAIQLGHRTGIQLDVGNPVVPFKSVDWSKSQL
jgi:hypothetical protein